MRSGWGPDLRLELETRHGTVHRVVARQRGYGSSRPGRWGRSGDIDDGHASRGEHGGGRPDQGRFVDGPRSRRRFTRHSVSHRY
jgi:hypothetical protein